MDPTEQMFNFEYEIKKSSGPSPTKCRTRNRRMEVTLHSIPIYFSIVKFYHAGPKLQNMSTKMQNKVENVMLADDFIPAVSYSINKKYRWMLADNIGVDTLQNLEDINGRIETIVIERQFTNYHDAWLLQHTLYHNFMLEGSKCKTIHRFEKYDENQAPVYEKKTVKGLGQPYLSISQRKNSEDREVQKDTPDLMVSYHIFKSPRSFKKVFDKNCNHFCGLGPECFSEREYFINNKKGKPEWIINEISNSAAPVWTDSETSEGSQDSDFEEKCLIESLHNKRYNLEDHVNEKRRHSRKKRAKQNKCYE